VSSLRIEDAVQHGRAATRHARRFVYSHHAPSLQPLMATDEAPLQALIRSPLTRGTLLYRLLKTLAV
jgi:hypothetical protein